MKPGEVISVEDFLPVRAKLAQDRRRLVFTNGVFDILHRGHVKYLQLTAALADVLVVGVNSDASVRRLKGNKRPVMPQADRAFLVSQLKPVDYVILFDEDTPLDLIQAVRPEILAKGADYQINEIVGAAEVKAYGGEVHRIPLTPNRATTNIIDIILQRFGTPR